MKENLETTEIGVPGENGIPGRLCAALFFVFLGELSSVIFLPKETLRTLFNGSIYWNLCLLFVLGVGVLLPVLGPLLSRRESRLKILEGLLLGVVLSSIAFFSIPPRLRTLMDEAALLSTSRSFSERESAEIITEQFPRESGFQTLAKYTDKRPPAFPFLVHLLNRLLGFQVENAFQVNLLLGACFLTLLFCFLREVFERSWAYATLAFCCAQPLLFLVIRSGAMDLISAVILLASFFLLFEFLRTPSRGVFQLLCFLLVAALFARYENAVVTLLLPLGLLFSGKLKKEYFRNSWYFLLLAILCYGVILQRVVATSMEQAPDMPAFSWYYFVLNNLHVLQQALRIDGDYHLLSPLVMFPALLGLLVLPCGEFRISQWSTFRRLTVLSALSTWMVVTTLYAGILLHGISSRYFLFFAVFSALLATSGLSELLEFLGKNVGGRVSKNAVLITLSFLFLGFSLPETQRMNAHYALSSEQSLDFVTRYRRDNGLKPSLIISNFPLLFSAANEGSISFPAFAAGRTPVMQLVEKVEGSNHAVLVLQLLFQVSGSPYPGNEIEAPFRLEPLAEFSFDGQLFRLSRLHVD